VVRHHFKWKRVSIAAGLCYGSRGGGAALAFHHQLGPYDTDTVIQALGELRRFLAGRRQPCCGTGYPLTAARRWPPGYAASGPGWSWSHCPATRPS
jgi:hypothetical protein